VAGFREPHPVVVTDDLLTVARELAEITRLVEDDDFGATLQRFVARVARTVPGCDHATITVRTRGAVETVAESGQVGLDESESGPVLEAVTFGEPRRLEDVATDQRWPGFAARVAGAGYRSCLALPLPTQSESSAVFTLYSATPHQFDDTSYDLVLLFALHAGAVFDNAALYHDSRQLVEQLRAALRTRSIVGRAQGLLMHRFGYGTDAAFTALKAASQNSNTKLRDIAGLLITGHEDGDFETTLQKLALTAAGKQP
jgi:GAF domain-containing protein